jgi:hypothetical protein
MHGKVQKGPTGLKGAKLNKEVDPEEKPKDDGFDSFGPETEPLVSKYEKAHPIQMPEILRLHMARKSSGMTEGLLMAARQEALDSGIGGRPPSGMIWRARTSTVFGGDLHQKLTELEKTLAPPMPDPQVMKKIIASSATPPSSGRRKSRAQ